jgi:cytochrome c biogenesis protein CcmG, thiol:disulfide interchange protein DsbE
MGARLQLHPNLRHLMALAIACLLLGTTAAQAVVVGEPFPGFELRDAEGALVRSDELFGRPWLVNVWASWCPQCRNELPLLARAAEELGAEGLGLLLVNASERQHVAREYLAAAGLTLRTLVDPAEAEAGLETTTEFLRRIRTRGLPTTYFIDADGIVRGLFVGELTPLSIVDQLATLGVAWQP